jgi:hypothetical protein
MSDTLKEKPYPDWKLHHSPKMKNCLEQNNKIIGLIEDPNNPSTTTQQLPEKSYPKNQS